MFQQRYRVAAVQEKEVWLCAHTLDRASLFSLSESRIESN